MDVSPDLRELLALFRYHGVECVVVGAHALAIHGVPRFTADLGGVPLRFLGREQLIRNKRAGGRSKDQADLDALLSEDE